MVEPDEASQIWGARVRRILGFCFLIPVAYLAHIGGGEPASPTSCGSNVSASGAS